MAAPVCGAGGAGGKSHTAWDFCSSRWDVSQTQQTDRAHGCEHRVSGRSVLWGRLRRWPRSGGGCERSLGGWVGDKGAPSWGKQEKREGTGAVGLSTSGDWSAEAGTARTKGCSGGEGRHRPEADDKALPCPCHSQLDSLMETSVGKRKAESGGIPSFICLKTLPTPVSGVTPGGCQFFL